MATTQAATKEKRCNHKGAVQITKSSFQWCGNCGAGKVEKAAADGAKVLRWQAPAMYQAKRGRQPNAVATKSAAAKAKPAKSVKEAIARVTKTAAKPAHPLRRSTDKPNKPGVIGQKQTRSRKPTEVIEAKPKRHRRTKAEMLAAREEHAKATIAAAAPKRRVRAQKKTDAVAEMFNSPPTQLVEQTEAVN